MKRVHLAIGLVLLMITAACGDDSDSADTTSTSGSDAAEEEVIPLSVVFGSRNMSQLDILVAMELDLFAEEGLDVPEPTLIPSSPGQALAAAQGDVDVAVPGVSGLFGAAAAGREVKAIATGARRAPHAVVISTSAAEAFADEGITPDSPIEERVAALEGLTIATSAAGGSVETLVRSAMADFDVDSSDAGQFVAIADVPAVAAALQQGQIDAAALAPPDSLVPVTSGDGVVWISLAEDDIPSVQDAYYTVHVARTSFIEENPEAIDRYTRALVRANELIADADPRVVDVLVEFFPTLDRSTLEDALEASLGAYAGSPASDEEGYEAALAQYNQTAEEPFPETLGFDDLFVPSFAEQAME